MKKIAEAVNWVKKHGLFPNVPIVESPHAPEVIVNGKKVLMFATNNYLGLATHPKIVQSAILSAILFSKDLQFVIALIFLRMSV